MRNRAGTSQVQATSSVTTSSAATPAQSRNSDAAVAKAAAAFLWPPPKAAACQACYSPYRPMLSKVTVPAVRVSVGLKPASTMRRLATPAGTLKVRSRAAKPIVVSSHRDDDVARTYRSTLQVWLTPP